MQNIRPIETIAEVRPKTIESIETIVDRKRKPETSNKEIDLALIEYSHLIHPDWKAWHAGCIKKRGIAYWIKLAKVAEQEGKDKPRYFTWLLSKDQ